MLWGVFFISDGNVAVPVIFVEVLDDGKTVALDGCADFVLSAFDDAAGDEGAAFLQELLHEARQRNNYVGDDVGGDDVVISAHGLAQIHIG